jgi:hypothetical protein
MIAKRQTTLLMRDPTVIAVILMPSSNQPTTNRRELQHVHARSLLDIKSSKQENDFDDTGGPNNLFPSNKSGLMKITIPLQ